VVMLMQCEWLLIGCKKISVQTVAAGKKLGTRGAANFFIIYFYVILPNKIINKTPSYRKENFKSRRESDLSEVRQFHARYANGTPS